MCTMGRPRRPVTIRIRYGYPNRIFLYFTCVFYNEQYAGEVRGPGRGLQHMYWRSMQVLQGVCANMRRSSRLVVSPI